MKNIKVNLELIIDGGKPEYRFKNKVGNLKLEKKTWYRFSCLLLLDDKATYIDDIKMEKAK